MSEPTEQEIDTKAKELVEQIKEAQKEMTCTKEEVDHAKALITKSVCNLVYQHPLVYGIISQCDMKPLPGLKTFGVKLNNGSVELLYDPKIVIKWYEEKPEKITAVMQHEAYHLVFSHLTLGLPGEIDIKSRSQKDAQLAQLWNVALDFKVNENIDEIWSGDGDGGLFQGACGKNALLKLLSLSETGNHNSIDLYGMLKKQSKNKGMPQSLDSHDFGDGSEMDAAEQEKNASVVQRIIKRAAEQLSEQERGNLPGEVRSAVDSLCHKKLDKRKWQDLLKQFLCSIRKPTKQGTWKRPSRRYGLKAKGKKHETQPDLAFCLDTSGSQSEEEVTKALETVLAYSHRFGQIWLIAGDTQVCYCELIKKGNANTKLMSFKTGRGGTTLQPLIDKAKEVRAHGVVMVSDGYCENLITHCKTIGLITKNGVKIPGIEHNLTLDEMLR